jgi:hypothetical protein
VKFSTNNFFRAKLTAAETHALDIIKHPIPISVFLKKITILKPKIAYDNDD